MAWRSVDNAPFAQRAGTIEWRVPSGVTDARGIANTWLTMLSRLLEFEYFSPPSRFCREWRGISIFGGNPVTRVAVFIDYENSRFGAREVFAYR